ncbi:hypothetical protein MAR_021611, partial [Mya arenaria]
MNYNLLFFKIHDSNTENEADCRGAVVEVLQTKLGIDHSDAENNEGIEAVMRAFDEQQDTYETSYSKLDSQFTERELRNGIKHLKNGINRPVVRWNAIHFLLTIVATQGALVLTSDQQFAQLQGDITLTCNTSVTSVEFKKDTKYVGRCSTFGCETSNTTKFLLIGNTEPAGYNVFSLTIMDFLVNDRGYYTCLNSYLIEQVSGTHITYA